MKLRSYSAILCLTLSLAGLSTSAHAQVPDPCTLYLCMASISGQGSKPASCTTPNIYWGQVYPMGLAVWYYPKGFDADMSYMVRQQYLNSCSGATNTAGNNSILQSIMSQWGRSPWAR